MSSPSAKKKKIQTVFLICFTIFMVVALAATLGLSWYNETKSAEDGAENQLSLAVESAIADLTAAEAQMQVPIVQEPVTDLADRMAEVVTADSQAKARAVARLINADTAILWEEGRLEALRQDMAVDEIQVTNAEGIIIASTTGAMDTNINDSPQSAAFMPAVNDPNFILAQPPETREGGIMYQLTGVARLDEPGVIQIGYSYTLPATAEGEDPTQPPTDMGIEQNINDDYTEIAQKYTLGGEGTMFLSQNGSIIASSRSEWQDAALSAVGIDASSVTGEGGRFNTTVDGESALGYYGLYNDITVIATMPKAGLYEITTDMILPAGVYAGLLIIVYVLTVLIVHRSMVRSVRKVSDSLERITHGHLNERVESYSNREVASISDNINWTVDTLEDALAGKYSNLESLKEQPAEKMNSVDTLYDVLPATPAEVDPPQEGAVPIVAGAMPTRGDSPEPPLEEEPPIDVAADTEAAATETERELYYARAIQMGALPRLTPSFPRERCEISAIMYPAKIVGGDFYDFFVIDEDHVGLVMADVAGKGIAAALYMMEIKNRIRFVMERGTELAPSFTELNQRLCGEQEHGMFVSVFAAILNLSDGNLTTVNAGHNTPLVGTLGGSFRWLDGRHNFVLGGEEGVVYQSSRHYLKRGETLFLYTNGVPEAMNSEGETFGNKRLISLLNSEKTAYKRPAILIQTVKKELDEFTATVEKVDDITIMAVKRGLC